MKNLNDPRAGILDSPPRGELSDSFFKGGWRCAGAMGPGAIEDHLVSLPFYVARSGDLRHCCYCRQCALECLGMVLEGS